MSLRIAFSPLQIKKAGNLTLPFNESEESLLLLVHGFGFASALADLGLPRDALVLALVGFNLGVEAGQLAIVGLFLPVAYGLRHTWIYRRMIFTGGSALIALIAAVWMMERVFVLKLLPV